MNKKITSVMVIVIIVILTFNTALGLSLSDNIDCELIKITEVGHKYMFGSSNTSNWVIDYNREFKVGDLVLVIYYTHNESDMYDDEYITAIKID